MLKSAAERETPALLEDFLTWGDLEARPRVIVDEQVCVVWMNAAAAASLKQARDFVLRRGAIMPQDLRQSAGFRAFVLSARPEVNSWCYHRPEGDGHVLFRAQGLRPAGASQRIGLVFHGTGSEFRPDWHDLRAIFRLTVAEDQVVRGLLDGHVADIVAERQGVSPETVRSQIRSAYGKMNVSSREALIRKLAPYRLD